MRPYGLVVRMFAHHPRGYGFEPPRYHQSFGRYLWKVFHSQFHGRSSVVMTGMWRCTAAASQWLYVHMILKMCAIVQRSAHWDDIYPSMGNKLLLLLLSVTWEMVCNSSGARDVRTLGVDTLDHRHGYWYSHLRNQLLVTYRPEWRTFDQWRKFVNPSAPRLLTPLGCGPCP